jgi:Ca-activated chloride channel family protein
VTKQDAQVIEVHPGERLDRDFILRWRIDPRDGALASSLVCAADPAGGAGTFALTIVPPSTTAVAARPRDVVFVIDRSGSMGGWKMVAARRAAARMIDTLTSRDRFCTIAFDDRLDLVPAAGLVDATDCNRFGAVEALAKVDARGGTEIAQPLRRALELLAGGTQDRERVIMLVTDGQVGNEDQVLRELAPNLRNIKMFALGIDQAVNAAFLRRLAAAGGGLCELVESQDRLDAVMAKVHRRIGTPIATELALRATGLEIDRGSIAPAKLPDVYAGAPIVVLGRYRGAAAPGATIEVEGTSLGEPLRMSVALTSAAAASTWLAASWARARIRDLEDRYAAGTRELEPEIVRVSKQFSVLSRFTAFVAIDRSQVVNPGGALHQVVQPVEPPAGWGASSAAPVSPRMSAVPPMSMSMGIASSFAPSSSGAGSASPPEGYTYGAPQSVASPMTVVGVVASPPASPAQAVPGAMASGAPTRVGGRQQYLESKRRRTEGTDEPSSSGVSIDAAYLAQLAALARRLASEASGRCDAATIRLLRQRLTQWIEDVRSVGGSRGLVSAVEELVTRLSAALAAPATLASEAAAVAAALAALAAGTPPPAAKRSRLSFWK